MCVTVVDCCRSCSKNDISDEELNRATGLLWTNSFACASGGGQAIFPVFSIVSHSCVSNCSHSVYPNNHLGLQAKALIRQGEELTISYISPNQVLIVIYRVLSVVIGILDLKFLRMMAHFLWDHGSDKTYISTANYVQLVIERLC